MSFDEVITTLLSPGASHMSASAIPTDVVTFERSQSFIRKLDIDQWIRIELIDTMYSMEQIQTWIWW
jgi:hypothetical protein